MSRERKSRAIVLTDKAQRRRGQWFSAAGTQLLVQANIESRRQRGWKKWSTYSIGDTDFASPVTVYGDPGPKRDCSICWREHGDEIQHVCE